MIVCRHCGGAAAVDAKRCPHCGGRPRIGGLRLLAGFFLILWIVDSWFHLGA
jgi:hypothetical protein